VRARLLGAIRAPGTILRRLRRSQD
jgi:hypothetical protein